MKLDEIIELMRKREVVDAFNALLPLVDDGNSDAQKLFMELVRTSWNMFLLCDDEDSLRIIEAGAKSGDPWLGYAFARYHDAVMPDSDSLQIATDYYDAAMKFGISDATVFEAMSWRDGEYGLINTKRYVEMCQAALNEGSHRATMQVALDRIYGNSGYDANPQSIHDTLVNFVHQSDQAGEHYDPHYLCLIAQACEELGDLNEAAEWYDKALDAGDPKACYNLALLRACDENGAVEDIDVFGAIMERGREIYAPTANMEITLAMPQEFFDEADEEDQEKYSNAILGELELAAQMGEPTADYMLAIYYRDGMFGFEQDYDEAFKWAARGAIIRDSSCFGVMADMIRDGIAPGNYSEEFRYICELKALRYGSNEYMVPVVEAYKRGHLTDYAAEIEQFYLPQIEEEDE